MGKGSNLRYYRLTEFNRGKTSFGMKDKLTAEPVPLETNPDGVVRVGKTRVTLDTVVAVFKEGSTAEEIVCRYPSLKLADVYATIGFYLNHQQQVEAYLQQWKQAVWSSHDPQGKVD
jgi:uncharacterized protein (DUF433 family)